MSDLEYSDEAENVLNKFYRVDSVLYVEGIDDIPFWEILFEKFSYLSIEITEVGGSHIKKYIEKILNGSILGIVACDGDFSYVEDFPVHRNIVRSYGYSIENTMLCKNSIIKAIKSTRRIPSHLINEEEIVNWIEHINSSTKKLVLYDIANHLQKTGKKVSGDNCDRFTITNQSPMLCKDKIENYLSGLDLILDSGIEGNIFVSLDENNREISDLLNGHFYFSAAVKFVKSTASHAGKKVASLSHDAFFGTLLLAFEAVFDNHHSHYDYYQKAVGNVVVEDK